MIAREAWERDPRPEFQFPRRAYSGTITDTRKRHHYGEATMITSTLTGASLASISWSRGREIVHLFRPKKATRFRVGHTSGTGTPAQNVARRDLGHHMTEQGYGPAQLDKSSSNRAAIRGREQQLIEANGGAKSEGGTSGNAINGISPNNKKRQYYLNEAEKEF
jgi:hypothetical protein